MKKNKKSHKKKYIFISISLLLVITTFYICLFFLFKPNNVKRNKEVASSYYGIFDDGTIYIAKANKNISFLVKSNKAGSYEIKDEDGNVVKSKIVTKKNSNYILPLKDYIKGITYTLELSDNEFIEEELKSTKKVIFKIEEDVHEDFKFANNVFGVKQKDIKIIDDNKIKITGDVKKDTIMIVEDEKGPINAYKIVSYDNEIAITEKPSLNEIYDNIDMYIENNVDFSKIDINKNLDNQIKKAVEASSLFNFLITDVYAESSFGNDFLEVSYENKKDKFSATIKMTFKADGKDKIGIEALKDHDLVLTFNFDISSDYIAKFQKGNTFMFDLALTKSSGMSIKLKSSNDVLTGIKEISDEEYSRSIEEIVKKLQKEVPDVSKNSVNIGAIEVPTGVWGLNVYFDIYFQCRLDVLTNLEITEQEEVVEHIGFVMGKDGEKTYKNLTSKNSSLGINVLGKEEIRVGVGVDAGISFFSKDFAHAGIGAEVGAYEEAFATLNVKYESLNNSINTDLVSKLEMGIYLNAYVEAGFDIGLYKASISKNLLETKYPVIKFGSDEIITSISSDPSVIVIGDNNKLKTPKINKNIKNIDSGVSKAEEIDIKDLIFKDDEGNILKFNKDYIDISENKDMSIYAIYETESSIFKTQIKVYEKGTQITDKSAIVNTNETNTINTNNNIKGYSIYDNNEAVKAYKKYILNKNYIDDFKEIVYSKNIYDVGYIIFDINKDGILELIIDAVEDDYIREWNRDIIYTYVDGNVVKVDDIYAYAGIRYNEMTNEIVYTEIRPNSVTAAYGFYRLENTKLVLNKTIGHDRGSFDINTGEYEYDNHFYIDGSGNIQNITSDEENSYFNNTNSFAYSDINTVN